jgi:hypothetical protein
VISQSAEKAFDVSVGRRHRGAFRVSSSTR